MIRPSCLVAFIVAAAMFPAIEASAQSGAADIPPGDIVALSRDYAQFLRASKPGRSADMSAVSQDGALRLDSYQSGQALVLSTPDGRIIAEKSLSSPVVHMLFSIDGLPVTVGQDNVISVWPAGFDGAPNRLIISGYEAIVENSVRRAVPLWVGRSTIAIGGWRGARGLYDVASGQKISGLSYDSQAIERILTSPGGDRFATLQGRGISVYRAADGAFLGYYDSQLPLSDTGSEQIWDAAFSSDGRAIHSTHWGGSWLSMDINSVAMADHGSVRDTGRFALSPDNGWIAAFRATNEPHQRVTRVQLFRADRSDIVPSDNDSCGNSALMVSAQSEENRFAIACREPVSLPHPDDLDALYEAYPEDFAFSPDGERLAAVTSGSRTDVNRLIIWDIALQTAIMDYPLERAPTRFDSLYNIRPVFSADGAFVSVAFPDDHAVSVPATPDSLVRKAAALGLTLKNGGN